MEVKGDPLNPKYVHFSGAEKRNQRDITPPRPPQGEDAIDFGQRLHYIRVFVWLSSFRPFGIRHDCLYRAIAHQLTYIYTFEVTLGEGLLARGRQPQ